MEQEKMSREELLKIIEEATRDGREELDLSSIGISELPDEIGQLTNLRELILINNQLMALPETIGQLTKLKTLHLYHNQLGTLPESIRHLTKLEELQIVDNGISTLPEWICELTNLIRNEQKITYNIFWIPLQRKTRHD